MMWCAVKNAHHQSGALCTYLSSRSGKYFLTMHWHIFGEISLLDIGRSYDSWSGVGEGKVPDSQGRSGLPCEFNADLWLPIPNET